MVTEHRVSGKPNSGKKGVARRKVLQAAAGVVASIAMPNLVRAQSPKVSAIVDMTDELLFVPEKIEIKVGETVEWRNVQSFPHSVTTDPGKVENPNNVELPADAKPFNSGAIRGGQVYRQTFTVAGVYRYACIPHERAYMLGTVIVS